MKEEEGESGWIQSRHTVCMDEILKERREMTRSYLSHAFLTTKKLSHSSLTFVSSAGELAEEKRSHMLIPIQPDEANIIGKNLKESVDIQWTSGHRSFLLHKGFLKWKKDLEPPPLQAGSGMTQGATLQPSDDLTHQCKN